MATSKVLKGTLPQPHSVGTDLITTRRFEAIVGTESTVAFTVSTKALIDTIAGTSTLWDKVQFLRFDVFSASTNTLGAYSALTVTVNNPASGYFGDIPTGYNDPVGPNRRAHVGVIPNELFRSTWIDSSDTSPLLTIHSPGTATSSALVQFVCILRSSAGAPTVVSGESTATAAWRQIQQEGSNAAAPAAPVQTEFLGAQQTKL